MKELEASISRDGVKTKSLDLGEWDISIGLEKTIYITNPNKYAKADLKALKNKDSRLSVNLPDEILPEETREVLLKIEGQVFESEVDEEKYFTNILDQLSGKVIWKVP